MKCRAASIPIYNNKRDRLGSGERWEEVKEMYSRVNLLFGDVVKVTPSSKSRRRHGVIHGAKRS